MNRAPGRHTLGWLSALYGIAILCAPALHGHGTPAEACAATKATLSHIKASHDDCPVCHFLIQTTLAPERQSAQPIRIAGGSAVLDRPLLTLSSRPGDARPRAPPSA